MFCVFLSLLQLRCFSSMAFTQRCNAGWLGSACVQTSVLWPHIVFDKTVTQPSCTCCQPDMLVWHPRFYSGTRRAPSCWALRVLSFLLPLQTAPRLMIRGHTTLCPLDSVPAATSVRLLLNIFSTCVHLTLNCFKHTVHSNKTCHGEVDFSIEFKCIYPFSYITIKSGVFKKQPLWLLEDVLSVGINGFVVLCGR